MSSSDTFRYISNELNISLDKKYKKIFSLDLQYRDNILNIDSYAFGFE